MTDDGYRRSETYAEFQANRVKRVRVQALERVDGVLAGRDFSAAKWEIRFRAYQGAAKTTGQTFVVNEAMTKVVGKSSAGDTGKAELSVLFAAAAVGAVTCEVVAVDTLEPDTPTPSGFREVVLEASWRPVGATPVA